MTGHQMSSERISREGLCPVCASTDIAVFFEILQVPVHCNLLSPTRDEAIQVRRGDIRLGFCHDCGHISNAAFDPELMEYGQAYENSLHFSPRFQSYAEALAARLIEYYDLRGKDVVEIGCGKGEFLTLLCEIGDNHGIGFDPSYVPEAKGKATAERVTFIRDFYSESYAGYAADLICCRHVLEHLRDPTGFLTMLRRTIGNRLSTVVFFEVPNVLFTLRDLAIWDIIYEHCSYFSPGSLARAVASCGFDVGKLTQEFQRQFLCMDALPSEGMDSTYEQSDEVKQISSRIASFPDEYRSKAGTWRHKLEQIESKGQRSVVWGAGSKGVTFLNTLEIQDQVEYVVDINPRKQGMYIAGTGQRIVPPEFLRDYQPDIVIVMNPIYKNEISELTQSLGLATEFMYA